MVLPHINKANIKGKRILLRLDLNVPLKEGRISNASRLERALPTVKMLRKRGAMVTICTHLGRPKGKKHSDLSLSLLLEPIANFLGEPVTFTAGNLNETTPLRLRENLRFDPREEADDISFAKELAQGHDLYVNDAFSCAHRAHASTHGIAKLLPAYAGPLMHKEIDTLHHTVGQGKHPIVALVGGAKVSSKLLVLQNLALKVDHLIVGGGMANTFLAARGQNVGISLCEWDLLDEARQIILHAQKNNCQIVLPTDAQISPTPDEPQKAEIVNLENMPKDQMILDIGPESSAQISLLIESAKTLLWNGPLGLFEIPPFDRSTVALAKLAANRAKSGALNAVAGGGDTIAALSHAGVLDDFTYVSTAGGAFLEWLEGKTLPGIAVLEN